jgi:hypothetical protein
MIAWAAIAALLLLPLAAMQVTDQVVWSPADFAAAGALLLGAGGALEIAARRAPSRAYLAGVAVAIAAALTLAWLVGAVGIIGTEADPANLMYAGVLASALVGAALARFRPRGMARAMFAAALAQALVAAVALALRAGSADPDWPADLLVLTGGFVGLWLLSGWLFLRAGRTVSAASGR